MALLLLLVLLLLVLQDTVLPAPRVGHKGPAAAGCGAAPAPVRGFGAGLAQHAAAAVAAGAGAEAGPRVAQAVRAGLHLARPAAAAAAALAAQAWAAGKVPRAHEGLARAAWGVLGLVLELLLVWVGQVWVGGDQDGARERAAAGRVDDLLLLVRLLGGEGCQRDAASCGAGG